MIAQNEFKGYPPNLVDLGIIGDNDHAFFHGGSAGWQEFFLLLNLDKAYPAYPF
jgi:hypothetical protein